MISAVALARKINQVCGGAVLGPWDVDELPETWLDVFRALADDLPTMQDSRAEAARIVAELKRRRKR